ncbi:Eco57I restriction-modification methylase domain-containing protein [Herpetosiphon llansteffanensis]|uniref:Eco57I restriction-modification methylase domain-containing protein n=1 Tax=Herpetosiphon llansteffanensis TaxID=2094568 RepID=UPI000D7C6FDE|nr:TaqI-like C-terminal specificity domain-containing protein [Herpetosiphon llansteffanensis]
MQYSFELPLPNREAIDIFSSVNNEPLLEDFTDRGAVYTRSEVIDLILNIAEYTVDKPLWSYRILEPSCGEGDFLEVIVDRLLSVYAPYLSHKTDPEIIHDLKSTILAFDIHLPSLQYTIKRLSRIFHAHNVSINVTNQLLSVWLHHGDFLLEDIPPVFTHVIGNPPYIRHESIASHLIKQYRSRYNTMTDRADIYIPFIEKGLQCLVPGGTIAIICSDRWTKNRYGEKLRNLITTKYHLDIYIDMSKVNPFQQTVAAYPAITLIRNAKPSKTRVAYCPSLDDITIQKLSNAFNQNGTPTNASFIHETVQLPGGTYPWMLNNSSQLPLIKRLERTFPLIEETGCSVRIGVATGADKIFIQPYDNFPIEDDRKLPIVKPQDIVSNAIQWHGLGVLNPFNDDGTLINLQDYPRVSAYLSAHESVLRQRHCARMNPRSWYRTIDRIHPTLTTTPKLLIPDIKDEPHIVYDQGNFYPHHNLYVITATQWDLHALLTVLRSKIMHLFIAAYSTKISGGYFRFQAQYLRRIRLPMWSDISLDLQQALCEAGRTNNIQEGLKATFDLYTISAHEQSLLLSLSK